MQSGEGDNQAACADGWKKAPNGGNEQTDKKAARAELKASHSRVEVPPGNHPNVRGLVHSDCTGGYGGVPFCQQQDGFCSTTNGSVSLQDL